MATIGFNDGSGYANLRGVFAAPFDRFRNFTPTRLPVGPLVTSIGTGRSVQWRYRLEYRVSLTLPHLSARVASGESSLVRAGRLVAYLIDGGAVDLAVEDDISTANVVSWLAPGSTPEIVLDDPQSMLYSLSATFANTTTAYTAGYGGFR